MERLVKVYAYISNNNDCDDFTGIYTPEKVYPESEFKSNKHHELTEGIKLYSNHSWSWYYSWNSSVSYENTEFVCKKVLIYNKKW